MDKDEIIKQITSELLEEIKSSNKSFSNEEVKNKINAKLDAIFNDGNSLKSTLDEEDEVLNNEFTKIDGNEDSFTASFDTEEDLEDDDIDNKIEDKQKSSGDFFQEVADIYKNEFNNSISCFRNAFESFKMVRKTSFFETILVVIFLAIPAILAGCIALIIVLILFLLWQLYLITKSIFELLKKAEISIKGINEKIRKKIKDLKSGGGFLNRLIFSNALYSLMMFNGIMYMLVKGLMLPVKSILDVEKILTNVLAKIEKGITTVLKAPSELALASTKEEALRRKKGVAKEKGSKTKNERKKTAEKEKVKDKLKLAEKEKAQISPQQQKVKIDEVSKALRETKLEVANAIAQNLKAEASQQKAQEFGDRAMDLAERSDRQRTPMSSMLSSPVDLGRTDIAGQILDNVLDAMRSSFDKTTNNINRVGGNPEDSVSARDAAVRGVEQRLQDDIKESQARLLAAEKEGNPNEIESARFQKDLAEQNLRDFQDRKSEISTKEEARRVEHSLQRDDAEQYAAKMDSMTFDESNERVLPEGFSMEKFVKEAQGLPVEEFNSRLFSELNQRMSELGYSQSDKEAVVATVYEHQSNIHKEFEEAREQEVESRSSEGQNRGFVDRVNEKANGSREQAM